MRTTPSAGTVATTLPSALASTISVPLVSVTRKPVQPCGAAGGQISPGSGAWHAARATSPGFSQNAPGCPAWQSASEVQPGLTQVSPLHVPPAAWQLAASQLTTLGGGSKDGASSALPCSLTAGGVAQ